MSKKKTILYILSDVRSGSTLLENIMSNSVDTVSVGELHHLDSHLNKGKWGATWGWKCSCGSDFVNCEFWSKVINVLEEKGIDNIQKTEVLKNYKRSLKARLTAIENPENKKIINTLDEIYEAIFATSGKSLIIDSSKDETQLAALLKYSKFNIKVIYLKRDIRAVVMSKLKWQIKFNQKPSNLYKALLSTKIKYNLQNKTFDKFIKKDQGLKLKYFDLVNQLPKTLNEIISFTEISQFDTPEYMERHRNHSVGGTPNRERRKISYDNAWKKKVAKRPVFRIIGKIMNII